jgi:hypothetical protein
VAAPRPAAAPAAVAADAERSRFRSRGLALLVAALTTGLLAVGALNRSRRARFPLY